LQNKYISGLLRDKAARNDGSARHQRITQPLQQ